MVCAWGFICGKMGNLNRVDVQLTNTALIPDQYIYIYEFSSKIYDLDNELELILYTQLESEQFQLAVNLLDAFIDFLMEHDSTNKER